MLFYFYNCVEIMIKMLEEAELTRKSHDWRENNEILKSTPSKAREKRPARADETAITF